MTNRQKKGLIIILIPLIVLIFILLVFYYSGFFQPEFEIWGGTTWGLFLFIVLIILGLLSILSLLVCLPLGIIYLTQPEKSVTDLKLSPAKQTEFKKQLTRTDNLIFIMITVFFGNGTLVYLVNRLLEDNQLVMKYLKLSPASYKSLADDISAFLGFLMIALFIALYFLFRRHFQLRQNLGLKGLDSLAERLKNFFEGYFRKNHDID